MAARANANAERLRQEPSDFDEEKLFKLLLGFCLFLLLVLGIIGLVQSEVIPVELFYHLTQQYWMNAATFYREKLDLVLKHATDGNMLIIQSLGTCFALIWSVCSQRWSTSGIDCIRLLGRAWKVLWKPVNDLISILGVEVPEPPEVSLAGIKHNAITLHWSRPGPQRPVVKYLIQVNGVNGRWY